MTPTNALARWQGQVDSTLGDHDRRLDTLEDRDEAKDTRLRLLEIAVGKHSLVVAALAATGGIVGTAIATLVIYLVLGINHHH